MQKIDLQKVMLEKNIFRILKWGDTETHQGFKYNQRDRK